MVQDLDTMQRLQEDDIRQDLDKKMVFLSGPRQVGKTTLSQSLAQGFSNSTYLNYDSDRDRSTMVKQQWDRDSDLVILDEIHKQKKWKT